MPDVSDIPLDELIKRLGNYNSEAISPDLGNPSRLQWNPDASGPLPTPREPFVPGNIIGGPSTLAPETPKLTQADLNFLPPRQEPRTDPMSGRVLPPPPPSALDAQTTPSRSSYGGPGVPPQTSPADMAPEVDGEQAPPPLTGFNNVSDAELAANNASVRGADNGSQYIQPSHVVSQPSPPIPPPQSVQPSLPIPPGEQAPTAEEVPTHKRDPNDILLEQYREPIMDMAKAARARDLARMDSPQARTDAHLMMMQGLIGRDSALSGRGADLLRKSAYDPIYGESLEQQGKSAQSMGLGQAASEKLDPASPTSEAMRIAMLASPMTDDWANRSVAQGEFPSVREAKEWMYNKSKNLHGAGMETFLSNVMKGGDFSKQSAERELTNVLADKNSWEGKQIRLAFETEQSLIKALGDPNHPVSRYAKGISKMMMGNKWRPEYEGMSALELAKLTPAIQPALHMIQYQAGNQLDTEKQKVMIPGEVEYDVQTANVLGMDMPVMPAGADPAKDTNRYALEQDVFNNALKVKTQASLLARAEGKLRVGEGANLAQAMRELERSLQAVGKSYDKDSVYGRLPGLLDQGNIEARSVLNDTNALVNDAVGHVTSTAKTLAPRIKRVDAIAATQEDNPALVKNPILGGSRHVSAGEVSPVNFTDPSHGIKSVPAWSQTINGTTHFWFYQGGVRRHFWPDKNENPSKYIAGPKAR